MVHREGGQLSFVQPGLGRFLGSCQQARSCRAMVGASSCLQTQRHGADRGDPQGPPARRVQGGNGFDFGLGRLGVQARCIVFPTCMQRGFSLGGKPRADLVVLQPGHVAPSSRRHPSKVGEHHQPRPETDDTCQCREIAPSRGGLIQFSAEAGFHCTPGTVIDSGDFQTLTVFKIRRRVARRSDVVVGPRQGLRAVHCDQTVRQLDGSENAGVSARLRRVGLVRPCAEARAVPVAGELRDGAASRPHRMMHILRRPSAFFTRLIEEELLRESRRGR